MTITGFFSSVTKWMRFEQISSDMIYESRFDSYLTDCNLMIQPSRYNHYLDQRVSEPS